MFYRVFLKKLKLPSFLSRFSSTKTNSYEKNENKLHRFLPPRPELDFDFMLDPENVDEIRDNIKNRKQIGDIDKLHHLWNRLGLFINNINELNSSQANRVNKLWNEFYEEAINIPNKTSPESPIGDENSAKIVHKNLAKRNFDFTPRTAEDLLSTHSTLRQDIAQECGEKAYILMDKAAILERILLDYTLNILKEENFKFIIVPDVINVETARNCGLATNSTTNKTLFTLKSDPRHCLSGTAELGIASFFENSILNFAELPSKFVALSRCFRPEIATGQGLYRVHEFTKVEMFAVTANETGHESEDMLNYFVEVQKNLFAGLNLNFKVLEMPTQELGAPAYRKFDIEAWMPGRGIYGEISSASNCTDFQSRRLLAKYKDNDGNLKYLHTVNGTACATSRLLIALMEQHQKHNSSIDNPECLKPFINKYTMAKGKNKPLKLKKTQMRTNFE